MELLFTATGKTREQVFTHPSQTPGNQEEMLSSQVWKVHLEMRGLNWKYKFGNCKHKHSIYNHNTGRKRQRPAWVQKEKKSDQSPSTEASHLRFREPRKTGKDQSAWENNTSVHLSVRTTTTRTNPNCLLRNLKVKTQNPFWQKYGGLMILKVALLVSDKGSEVRIMVCKDSTHMLFLLSQVNKSRAQGSKQKKTKPLRLKYSETYSLNELMTR